MNDEEKYQKELFEFKKTRRLFPKLSDFFPKADFERNIIFTLTLDRLVFIMIGILMAMVVVYALGVEAGKSRPSGDVQPPPAAAPAAVVAPQAARVEPHPAAKAVPRPQPVKAIQPAKMSAKSYTIVAATFTRKDNAAQEVARLRSQGFDASLTQSDVYFQACVGAYAERSVPEAQRDLKNLKRVYKDAYIKPR